MTDQPLRYCCTTPSALCLWGAAFLVLFGAGLLAVEIWPGLDQYGQTLVLSALGIACLVNFRINRTFHCGITGPLFLIAAGIVAGAEAGVWEVNISIIWALLMIGIGGAAFLEWRITRDVAHS